MRASNRLNPGWFDHQRTPLIQLRRAIDVALDDWIPTKPGAKVVDFGCGDAPYRTLFQSRGFEYIACDLDEPADIIFQPGARVPIEDGVADLVVSFQVLEHVWELEWYLGECRRMLKPGGSLLLSTHGVWLYHPHPGDYRRWTHAGLKRQLEECGLSVSKMEGLVGPLAWTTQFRLLGFHQLALALPIFGPVLFAPLAAVMNLRMVLEDSITPAATKFDHSAIYVTLSHPA